MVLFILRCHVYASVLLVYFIDKVHFCILQNFCFDKNELSIDDSSPALQKLVSNQSSLEWECSSPSWHLQLTWIWYKLKRDLHIDKTVCVCVCVCVYCPGCQYEASVYANGESFQSPKTPCDDCRCSVSTHSYRIIIH